MPGLVCTCSPPKPVLAIFVTLVPAHAIGETQVADWTTCRVPSSVHGGHVARYMGGVVEWRRSASEVVACRHLARSTAISVLCVIRVRDVLVNGGSMEKRSSTQRPTNRNSRHYSI